uniref:Uncharacterized protein n=1 Tax=Skeletonema marinoi TaxID=267567 RepID=A0A7S2Q2R9_9STRA|mmetsp:Transcript_8536/g.14494  ORF Transcript_8536/g.14494 Transcript_8536/m.14494 type:complete len:302 (+) Transcript_8536:448-1353(+)
MPLFTTDAMHSSNFSHHPKISRSGRRNRSYSDAHVHFATAQTTASVTDAFSNNQINDDIAHFDDNPIEVVAEKGIISPAATNQHQQHSGGNRPRSKSESEPHHRRTPHKKKYPHHHPNRHHHHLNYGRHSPPPLSSCGKMWVRPMSARRNGMETHHVTTSALGDRHLSSLTSSGGSPSFSSHPQAKSKGVPSANEEATTTSDRSVTKSKKTSSIDSRTTGLEDDLMMMMYTTSSSPSPPTLFGSGYTTTSYPLSHDSPTTPMAFGESGKPIVRVKNRHQDDLFESSFLPVVNLTNKSGDVK